MSEFIEYDPNEFSVEKASVTSAVVGGSTVGSGLIGEDVGVWTIIDLASFNYTIGYNPDSDAEGEVGTLIYDSESATVSKSYWGEPEAYPLRTGDKVRVRYGTVFQYLGTASDTRTQWTAVPQAQRRGARYKVVFSANILGTYAVALSKRVCWESLPEELAVDRVERWVDIVDDPGPWQGPEAYLSEWTVDGGTVTQAGTRIQFTSSSGDQVYMNYTEPIDLLGNTFRIRLDMAAAPNVSTLFYMSNPDDGDEIEFWIDHPGTVNALSMSWYASADGGSATNTITPYDPVEHAWLRFRQDNSGIVYFGISPNGTTWTEVFASDSPVNLTGATPSITMYATSTPQTGYIGSYMVRPWLHN